MNVQAYRIYNFYGMSKNFDFTLSSDIISENKAECLMEILKKGKNNVFLLSGLSFQEIVLIKQACEAYASQGSEKAGIIAEKISEALENTII